MHKKQKPKNIIYTAIFAAIICVFTIMLKIPAAGGYYHIGDAFVYLAGAFLPFPGAMLAGAAGGALADLFSGYAAYILPTFVIKALVAACFTNKKTKILCGKNLAAVALASGITVGGYYITEAVMLKSFTAAMASLYGNVGQAAASAAVFIAAGAAIDKGKFKDKI